MKIEQLNPIDYAGKRFTTSYLSSGYYDIQAKKDGFSFKKCETKTQKRYELTDVMFADWLEHPIAYGAFEKGQLVGYVEGTLETWNQRYRISNLVIFEEEQRHSGIGSKLFQKIMEEAKKSKARMVVLETESCNVNAIAFYKKMGMEVIGFDQYAYSNDAHQTHVMLVWMGKCCDLL